jgi:hypothetical protein
MLAKRDGLHRLLLTTCIIEGTFLRKRSGRSVIAVISVISVIRLSFYQIARTITSIIAVIADYPKGWPFRTKSLAPQEKASESALQGSLYGLAEAKLVSAKFRHLVTRMALQANLSMRPNFR